jgi:hypothetical protein
VHGRQTPQSRHQQQMLVGDREQTSTNRPQDCLHWKIVWCVKGLNEPPNSHTLQSMWDYYAHTQGGEAVLNWNDIQANGNMPPLLGNAIRKDKA